MGNTEFSELCIEKVAEKIGYSKDELFIVWLCKVLRNNKALVSSTRSGDGLYVECTFNGEKIKCILMYTKKNKTHALNCRRSNNMELKDTIDLMNNEDYRERFKAEYYQTRIRYDKLHKMIIKMEAGTCDFAPSCSLEVNKEQAQIMHDYLHILEVRAQIEKIEL